MPEIKVQRPGTSPEIAFAEIHIPDDADMGTGTYTIDFATGALPSDKAISSIMASPPSFQIAVTVSPMGKVAILLGTAAGPPKHGNSFRLPARIDRAAAHTLIVGFAQWWVGAAALNGQPLTETPQEPGKLN